MQITYRSLTDGEIVALEDQGCSCKDWSLLQVHPHFKSTWCRNVHFSGVVRLGEFGKPLIFSGGITRESGLYNCTLHDCTLGSHVFIRNVNNYIAGYEIEDDVIIENVDLMVATPKSTYGNGVRVAVLDETGGREVPIFNGLNAQIAYMMAFYRHDVELIEKLEAMVADYCKGVQSMVCKVGRGARIVNCGTIEDVQIGPKANLTRALKLQNGSLNSVAEDPIYVGSGVVAKDFIVQSGGHLSESAIIMHSFIGQGTHLERGFSAENSLFFSNCIASHGEACSIFAGPFTVTHHKSTLLIGGYFSFFNAGSGSNQSNHAYKLGPVHQGIVERGLKFSSDSYLLWPARIGAFSLVMGRHYGHPDTSDFPFSYLLGDTDKTTLIPGINLRSIGVLRDVKKWPQRDIRKDPQRMDQIHFNHLNPITVRKMVRAIDLLRDYQSQAHPSQDGFYYKNCFIPKRWLSRSVRLYQLGISAFCGQVFMKRLVNGSFVSFEEVHERLRPRECFVKSQWVDIAGLMTPKPLVDKLIRDVKKGTVSSWEELGERFNYMGKRYEVFEWAFALDVLQKIVDKPYQDWDPQDLMVVLERLREDTTELSQLMYADGNKEFDVYARIGFGIDGNEEVRDLDFREVRGTYQAHQTILGIKEADEEFREQINLLKQRLVAIC